MSRTLNRVNPAGLTSLWDEDWKKAGDGWYDLSGIPVSQGEKYGPRPNLKSVFNADALIA